MFSQLLKFSITSPLVLFFNHRRKNLLISFVSKHLLLIVNHIFEFLSMQLYLLISLIFKNPRGIGSDWNFYSKENGRFQELSLESFKYKRFFRKFIDLKKALSTQRIPYRYRSQIATKPPTNIKPSLL